MKLTSFARALMLASTLSITGALFAGPTPYPSQSDEAAWPGVGPIRIGSWMSDQRTYFWTLREGSQQSVVFVGDSLVGGWKTLRQDFPGIKVANRGVGGDVSRGVLFRFQEDVLDLHPRAIVMCVGSNDLSAHAKTQATISNIAILVTRAHEADPKIPVIICTIPPRNVPNSPIVSGSLGSLNAALKTFAEGKPNVVIVDLFTALATPEGTPHPDYIGKDGIHITPAGFEKWATLLRPVFDSLRIVATPTAK
jgi:lysophospholipase L1-like esterase